MNYDYGLDKTTPPTTYPVTLAQAKAQSRIPTDRDAEDPMIEDIHIPAATAYCEHETHRQFITATFTMTLDEFPAVIYLPRPPGATVTSVAYVDTDGADQPLVDGTDYSTDFTTLVSTIMPFYNTTWPSTRAQKAAVTVIYTAGFGAASAVPAELKNAILLATEDYFIHRSHSTELRLQENMALKRLLAIWTVLEAA